MYASETTACLRHHLLGDIVSDLVAVDNGDVFALKQIGDCGFACCNAASESKDQHNMSCTRQSGKSSCIRHLNEVTHQRSITQRSCISGSSYHEFQ